MSGIDLTSGEVSPGRRAANKADKLRRISDAARTLFQNKGFDGTTMRDISAHAGVGFGTLFDYATSKRDLLFLIFNPELEDVLDRSIEEAATTTGIVDQLIALFRGYYALYADQREISFAILRELTFFSEGNEARKFLGHRSRFISSVSVLIRAAVHTGELRSAVDVDQASRVVFALYAWEVRRWLAQDNPVLERGLHELAELLELVIAGFRVGRDSDSVPQPPPLNSIGKRTQNY